MRHANSRPSGRRSDRNSGGKKQGDHLTAKSHSASAQATDIDALSRPKPAEPGTKSKHHYRTQPQKGHNRLPKGGGSVQAANRYQTRSITAQNKRNKPAGQHTKVSANKTVKPSAPADTNSKGPSTVRQRRQAHLEEEAAKKRKLIDEYITTGDPKVFIPFLAPFASTNSTGQHGKRRKLGEWKWDREVERHWREDKTSGEPGARIWAPVEESFI
ncbi:hypothetical protein QBC41DRAFT_227279 [Cercophora samala]|uniref:Uncharacterized protein n=1 Tax=Cercophora samala TaxID=330535 RepID=A0AA39ZBM9_9PEZI|nr:hypothetical protein QBC41DRAFT_227279 [Cercophora samala]